MFSFIIKRFSTIQLALTNHSVPTSVFPRALISYPDVTLFWETWVRNKPILVPRASIFWSRDQRVALGTRMRLAAPDTSYASTSHWFIALNCDTPDVITSPFFYE